MGSVSWLVEADVFDRHSYYIHVFENMHIPN